jgi:hypothetical protein
MSAVADDYAIVHRNPERLGDVNDRVGHVDVGTRGPCPGSRRRLAQVSKRDDVDWGARDVLPEATAIR